MCVLRPQSCDYYTFEDLPVDLTPWSETYRVVRSLCATACLSYVPQ
jgi:hypothetical protein